MAQVLLFNIGGEKRKKLRFLLLRLGLEARDVPPEEFSLPIGTLCGRPVAADAEDGGEAPFTGEMLVMDALSPTQFRGLLDGLRRSRAAVALKAVVTEHNQLWPAARLYRELTAEHEAMKQAAGNSPHRSEL